MYIRGEGGLTKDEAQAAGLLKIACQRDDPTGCGNLAIMYRDGMGGLEKDAARAVELYKKACAAGNAAACDGLKRLVTSQ